MYSLNGVPLSNSALGWVLRAPSRPLSEILRRLQTLVLPNQDGVESVPGSDDASTLTFVVRTPRVNLETLYAVIGASPLELTVTGVPGRTIAVELASGVPEGYGPRDAVVDVTFGLRLNGVFWRGAQVTSSVVTINAASVEAQVMAGLSAPVGDALVRVRGPITNARVADAGGSWLSIPIALTASQYLRFEPKAGKAFLTTTDVWTGGTDSSGVVDFGGPRGFFEITPTFAAATPGTRIGKLTTTSTARTNAQIQVQGRTAHRV